MTPLRLRELELGVGRLTDVEVADGWHFCPEWDGMCIQLDSPEGEACDCPLPAQRLSDSPLSEARPTNKQGA